MKQADKIKELLDILDEQYNNYICYKKEVEKMYEAGQEKTAYYYDMKRSLALDNLIEIRNAIVLIVEDLENKQ